MTSYPWLSTPKPRFILSMPRYGCVPQRDKQSSLQTSGHTNILIRAGAFPQGGIKIRMDLIRLCTKSHEYNIVIWSMAVTVDVSMHVMDMGWILWIWTLFGRGFLSN